MSSDSDDSEPGRVDTETLEDLVTWRSQLSEEIAFLTKALKEVDNRVNDLMLEQLIIKHMKKEKSQVESDEESCTSVREETEEELYLSVPMDVQQCVEEDDDEEIEES